LKLSLGNAQHFFIWSGDFVEEDTLDVFLSHLQPGMTVLDIGANLGLFSCAIAQAIGPNGRLFSFEPMPHVHQDLVTNLQLNEFTNVVPEQIALSDSTGQMTFHVGHRDGLSSLVRPSGSGRVVEVQTTTVDQYLETHGIERVDAVKIDVEGAEPFVIRGMTRTLSRPGRPLLMVEHNSSALAAGGSSPRELFDMIAAYGYQPHVIHGNRVEPVAEVVKPPRGGEGVVNYLFLPVAG
jgi:FkbM family methyltransferase